MNVNIVANPDLVSKLRNGLTDFKLDLGRNLTDLHTGAWRIDDNFVEQFYTDSNYIVYKIGKYGRIQFYQSHRMPDEFIYVYFDNNKLEIRYNSEEATNVEKYLSKILYLTEHGNLEGFDTENEESFNQGN
jgi:hypothetical protein